jgi:hypothetical protein
LLSISQLARTAVTDSVDQLIAGGAIVRVHGDAKAARTDTVAARAHLKSAAAVAQSDPVGAFSLAYDAIRKALIAHMRAHGLRVRSGVGAHYQTGRYGLGALGGRGVDDALGQFDTLRALRNRSEYSGALVKEADVHEAISYAEAVLNLVEENLS